MNITIKNYEEYALDYLDGSLGHQEMAAFQKFLEQHPDIREELDGIDQIVLEPRLDIPYPNKAVLYRQKGGRIIPFPLLSRIAAAVILLVAAALFVVWYAQNDPSGITITSNQPQMTQNDNDDINLPATKTPMPVEQPETNVMAHKGNVPGKEDQTDISSPALTFGSEQPEQRTNIPGKKENTKIQTTGISPVEDQPFLAAETSETEPRSVDNPNQTHQTRQGMAEEKVAFLPGINSSVATSQSLRIESVYPQRTEETNNTFEIHIPGQFLSETWGDVSLANFKNKLLPEFLNIKN